MVAVPVLPVKAIPDLKSISIYNQYQGNLKKNKKKVSLCFFVLCFVLNTDLKFIGLTVT